VASAREKTARTPARMGGLSGADDWREAFSEPDEASKADEAPPGRRLLSMPAFLLGLGHLQHKAPA
jgi:hypothetical protein